MQITNYQQPIYKSEFSEYSDTHMVRWCVCMLTVVLSVILAPPLGVQILYYLQMTKPSR